MAAAFFASLSHEGTGMADTFTDEDILELYVSHGRNATALAHVLGVHESNARRRVARAKLACGDAQMILDRLDPEVKNRIVEELELASVPAEGSRVSSVWLKGEGVSVHLVPTRADDEPPFAPASFGPIIYTPTAHRTDPFQRVFFWPDTQIGYYRNLETDVLEPFHDLAAIDVALQVMYDLRPHKVVILGDLGDQAQFSKYPQVPQFRGTAQPSINFITWLLARIRALVGCECEIVLIEGNHERRLQSSIALRYPELYEVRAAGAKYSAVSIQNLWSLERLGITYLGPFPRAQYWLTPKLVAMHQPEAKDMDRRATVVHGHHPHLKSDSHSVHYYHGIETYQDITIAGLMRLDENTDPNNLYPSAVPADKERLRWAQGIGVAYIRDDDTFEVVSIKIRRGYAFFEGRGYQGVATDETINAWRTPETVR
jgi:hypothetical protein